MAVLSMMKKIIMYVVAFAVFYARADYQTVDGIEWRYHAGSYEAVVEGISSYHYNLIEVTIPAVLGGVPVTRIASCAFRNCDFLLSVVTPGTVEEIGYDAFEDCERLISVTIPSSVRYMDGGFRNCTMLQSVTIPEDTVFYGGSSTFEGCRSLTSVTIPSPPNGIMNNMFKDCVSLTSVKILGDCYGISSD